MEYACHKCGASIEEGTPFCPQCNAPQIRVAFGEVASGSGIDPSVTVVPQAKPGIQWAQALPAASLAGVIAALLMFIPLGAFGLGMTAGGILAVLFYKRRSPLSDITPGMGAKIGAASGALGFGLFAIFTAVEVLVFHSGGQLRTALLEAIQQSAARSSEPQAQQAIEYLKSPAGLALMMGLGLVLVLIMFLLLSSLGGAIAAAMSRRKGRL